MVNSITCRAVPARNRVHISAEFCFRASSNRTHWQIRMINRTVPPCGVIGSIDSAETDDDDPAADRVGLAVDSGGLLGSLWCCQSRGPGGNNMLSCCSIRQPSTYPLRSAITERRMSTTKMKPFIKAFDVVSNYNVRINFHRTRLGFGVRSASACGSRCCGWGAGCFAGTFGVWKAGWTGRNRYALALCVDGGPKQNPEAA